LVAHLSVVPVCTSPVGLVRSSFFSLRARHTPFTAPCRHARARAKEGPAPNPPPPSPPSPNSPTSPHIPPVRFHGQDRIAAQLLTRGALACLVDAHGRTAADFARMRGHAALARRLEAVRAEELESIREAEVAAGRGDDEGAMDAAPAPGAAPNAGADDEELYDYYVVSGATGGGEGGEKGGGAAGAAVEADGSAAAASVGVTARVTVEGLEDSDSEDDWYNDDGSASRCVTVTLGPRTPPAQLCGD
jgi:hypothetical protein